LNQVPKENLAKIFEKGARLNREIAEKISTAVKERIFSQIPGSQPITSSLVESEIALPPENQSGAEFKKTRKDTYREPIK